MSIFVLSSIPVIIVSAPEWGGGGYLGILGGGVPPGSPNADPISDQKLSVFTPVFIPDFRPGIGRNYVIIT